MAINFPNSPTNGQVFTDPNGTNWTYDSAVNSWTAEGAGPLVPADATETVKGIVELATAAETTTGTDSVRAVTPAGVASGYIKKNIANLPVLP